MASSVLARALKRSASWAIYATGLSVSVSVLWHFVPQPAKDAVAAMAVYDSAVHGETTKIAANTAKMASALDQILIELQKVNAVLGMPGPCSSGLGASSGQQLASVGAVLDGQRPQMQQWQLPNNIPLNLGNVTGARQFIQSSLFKLPPQVSGAFQGAQRHEIERYRETARREATQGSLALAYQQKQDIPGSASRAASAGSQADSASTIKDAACAQNKLLAAILEQALAQRSLAAAQVESAGALMVNDVPIDMPQHGREFSPLTFGGQAPGGQSGRLGD